MRPLVREAVRHWNQFWFEASEDYLSSLALFRIVFGLVMAFFYMTRQQDVALYYTNEGLMPVSYLNTLEPLKYNFSSFLYINNLPLLQCLHGLLIAACVSLSFGFLTRFSALLVYGLAHEFFQRDPAAMFGVDSISIFFALYLIFSRAGERYSLDAIFFKFKKTGEWGRMLGSVSYRLMQVQLCVVYTYSGWEKLKGTRWWDGSAVWDVMTMGNLQRWDMSFVSHMPFVLALIAYTVLFFEIYFVVLICFERIRNYVLAYGVMMHIGIIIFMNLPSFGSMMISVYALFLSGSLVDQWFAALHKRVPLPIFASR